MIDVDPLPGMTPGVAQFYRRCSVAGTWRADGAVVCGSQKELALLFQLSQGTVASHVSPFKPPDLSSSEYRSWSSRVTDKQHSPNPSTPSRPHSRTPS